jgi:hypothetical protein
LFAEIDRQVHRRLFLHSHGWIDFEISQFPKRITWRRKVRMA